MKVGKYILFLLIALAPITVLCKVRGIENMTGGLLLGSTLLPWVLFYLLIEKAKANERYAMTLYFATYVLYFFFLAVIGMQGLWKTTGIMIIASLAAWLADWIGASKKLLNDEEQ